MGEMKRSDVSSRALKVAGAGPSRGGYQLHAASGGEFTLRD